MARERVNLKRKVFSKKQKKKIYIYSEGENTEPRYFKAYEREVSSSIVTVVLENERGVPATLLEKAIVKKNDINKRSYIKDNGSKDQVWIVFDEDEHPNIPKVILKCDQLDIKYAHSNPCFEVWLILHEEDYDRDEHRHATQRKCEEVCLGYTSGTRKIPDVAPLMKKVFDAEARAISMENRRSRDGGTAPSTNVYKLLKEIRNE